MTLVQEARDRGDPLNGNLMYQRFAEEVRFPVATKRHKYNCC